MNGQRRYLWTDAYGICNYLSQYVLVETLRDQFTPEEIQAKQRDYIHAAKTLIDSVVSSLGQPRSLESPMKMNTHGNPIGLRIGKVLTSHPTDMGMKYDGNHYSYSKR